MLDVSISGLDELQGRLASFPGAFLAKLNLSCEELVAALADKVRSDKLGGGVLNSRSGALTASIFADVIGAAEDVTATVGSAGVPYADLQEYGGKTAAHEIVPDKAHALAFVAGGQARFARRVNHPGSQIPERSYLRASLEELGPEIKARLTEAVGAAWSET
jgi:phage gpG-like protein